MKFSPCAFLLLCLMPVMHTTAQDHNGLFTRLQALSQSRTDFFNVDGTDITSHRAPGEFSPKGIRKALRQYRVREGDLAASDTALPYPNYFISQAEEAAPGVTQYMSRYFIGHNGSIFALTFLSFNKNDRAFQREFARLVIDGGIPATVYENTGKDSINFAGRKIDIGAMCRFMNVNNMQCPYNGQMNWSVHKDAADAAATIKNSISILDTEKRGRFISRDTVEVIFEGTPVQAIRAVFDVKGVAGALVGMSGAKVLNTFFVWGPVRGNYVSCVMSYWNNDSVTKSGLPALLDKVIRLKNNDITAEQPAGAK